MVFVSTRAIVQTRNKPNQPKQLDLLEETGVDVTWIEGEDTRIDTVGFNPDFDRIYSAFAAYAFCFCFSAKPLLTIGTCCNVYDKKTVRPKMSIPPPAMLILRSHTDFTCLSMAQDA